MNKYHKSPAEGWHSLNLIVIMPKVTERAVA